jgi:hypothetical protein
MTKPLSFYSRDLFPQLMEWKTAFRKMNIPFFAFITIVRQPIICIKNKRCEIRRGIVKEAIANKTRSRSIRGVEDMLLLSHTDVQCRYYLRQWLPMAYDHKDNNPPTLQVCQNVYRKMTEFFDWIGRLERFDDIL